MWFGGYLVSKGTYSPGDVLKVFFSVLIGIFSFLSHQSVSIRHIHWHPKIRFHHHDLQQVLSVLVKLVPPSRQLLLDALQPAPYLTSLIVHQRLMHLPQQELNLRMYKARLSLRVRAFPQISLLLQSRIPSLFRRCQF